MSVVPETPVGYVVAADVYVSYSEYYGDGTIYGYTELLMPDGNPVKGAGKTKADLINENAVLGNNLGSVTGDIIAVEMPEVAEVPASEAAEVAPEAAEVAEVPEVAPAPEVSDRYTVSLSIFGFDITREFTAKIDVEGRKIYLS
jgi:hypothetical protein